MQNKQIKPQWLVNHKAEMLDHYTSLIQMPGWKDYTDHRLKELEADLYGLCRGITKRIKSDIESKK